MLLTLLVVFELFGILFLFGDSKFGLFEIFATLDATTPL